MQGVAMLSSILKSERAIEVNIVIIRTFVLIRKYSLSFEELSKKIASLEKSTAIILNRYLKYPITCLQKNNSSRS